jgi:integrase
MSEARELTYLYLMSPFTSQNSLTDANFVPFLSYWKSILNGGPVGAKHNPADRFIKERHRFTAKGKPRHEFYLDIPACKKSKRKRVREPFDTFKEAEAAYYLEMGLRNPLTHDLLNIDPVILHIVHTNMKKLNDQPEPVSKSFDLTIALSEAIETHIWESEVITLETLQKAVVEEQIKLGKVPGANKKDGYIGTINWAFKALYKDEEKRFPKECNIRTIRPKDLNDFFLTARAKLKATTARTLYRVLGTSMNRGVAWEMLRKNPLHAVKAPGDDTHEIIIHSREQTEALLWTAWDYLPHLIPSLFLGYYGGSSPTEARKLRWEDLNLKLAQFHVGKKATKPTRVVLERDVDFLNPEQAVRFLTPLAKTTGLVLSVENPDDLRVLRALATSEYGIEIPQWFGSIRRRTWMSHLFHTKRVTTDQLKRLAGQHRDSNEAFESYIAYVSLPNALAYFEIMPLDRPPGTKSIPPELIKELTALANAKKSKSSAKPDKKQKQ